MVGGKKTLPRKVSLRWSLLVVLVCFGLFHTAKMGGGGNVLRTTTDRGSGCCVPCATPGNTCCMPCSDVSSAREHDLLMATMEGLTLHIDSKHHDDYKHLETRAWAMMSHIGNRPPQATFYYDWLRSLGKLQHLCEIGFNGGHSALIFLAASATGLKEKDADLTVFDLGMWTYSPTGQQYVEMLYPRRFEFIKGNSTEVVPKWTKDHPNEKCDVFSVDGDHSYEGAKIDIINAAKATKKGGRMILDDMMAKKQTRRAFDEAVAEGVLKHAHCTGDVPVHTGYVDRYDDLNARFLSMSWCYATIA